MTEMNYYTRDTASDGSYLTSPETSTACSTPRNSDNENCSTCIHRHDDSPKSATSFCLDCEDIFSMQKRCCLNFQCGRKLKNPTKRRALAKAYAPCLVPLFCYSCIKKLQKVAGKRRNSEDQLIACHDAWQAIVAGYLAQMNCEWINKDLPRGPLKDMVQRFNENFATTTVDDWFKKHRPSMNWKSMIGGQKLFRVQVVSKINLMCSCRVINDCTERFKDCGQEKMGIELSFIDWEDLFSINSTVVLVCLPRQTGRRLNCTSYLVKEVVKPAGDAFQDKNRNFQIFEGDAFGELMNWTYDVTQMNCGESGIIPPPLCIETETFHRDAFFQTLPMEWTERISATTIGSSDHGLLSPAAAYFGD